MCTTVAVMQNIAHCFQIERAPQLHLTVNCCCCRRSWVYHNDTVPIQNNTVWNGLIVWPMVMLLVAEYWIKSFKLMWKNKKKKGVLFCHSSIPLLSLSLSHALSSLLYFKKIKLWMLLTTKDRCPLLFSGMVGLYSSLAWSPTGCNGSAPATVTGPTFDHRVSCKGRVALSSLTQLFMKYTVGKWDKGLCHSLPMAILYAHVPFQIDWATHRGEKMTQTDRQTDGWMEFSSFYGRIIG